MTSDLTQALWVILVITFSSCLLSPTLVWLLSPHRSEPQAH